MPMTPFQIIKDTTLQAGMVAVLLKQRLVASETTASFMSKYWGDLGEGAITWDVASRIVTAERIVYQIGSVRFNWFGSHRSEERLTHGIAFMTTGATPQLIAFRHFRRRVPILPETLELRLPFKVLAIKCFA